MVVVGGIDDLGEKIREEVEQGAAHVGREGKTG